MNPNILRTVLLGFVPHPNLRIHCNSYRIWNTVYRAVIDHQLYHISTRRIGHKSGVRIIEVTPAFAEFLFYTLLVSILL